MSRRWIAWPLIVGGHVVVVVVLLLSDRYVRVAERTAREALAIVLVPARAPPREESRVRAPAEEEQRASRARPDRFSPERVPESGSNAITLPRRDVDWERAAEHAAAAATAPPRRGFGMPPSSAKPPLPPEFGWDRTHTERIHPVEGGGIGIRINDNCEIVLMPLPIAGCALGKRKARGDLFEGMKSPDRPASSVPDVPR